MAVVANFTGFQRDCCYGLSLTDTSSTTGGDAIYNGMGEITYEVFDPIANSWKEIAKTVRGNTISTSCCTFDASPIPYEIRSRLVITQTINCIVTVIYDVYSATQNYTILEYKPFLEIATNIACCNPLQKNNLNVNLGFELEVTVNEYIANNTNLITKTVTLVSGTGGLGDPIILTMANTTGIEDGMYVDGTGLNDDATYTVSSHTSTTVTISGSTVPSNGTFNFGCDSIKYTVLNKTGAVLESKQIGFGRLLQASNTPLQYANIGYSILTPTLFDEKTNYRLTVEIANCCHSEIKEYIINICENYKVEYIDCNSIVITNYLIGYGNRHFQISKLNSSLDSFSVIVPDTIIPNAPALTGSISVTIPITKDGVYLLALADETTNNSIADFTLNTNVGFTKSYIFIMDCNIQKCLISQSKDLACLNFDCGFMSLNNVDQRKTLFNYLKMFNFQNIIYSSWTKYKNQIQFYETSAINTAVIATFADTQLAIDELLAICGCGDSSKVKAVNQDCGCNGSTN